MATSKDNGNGTTLRWAIAVLVSIAVIVIGFSVTLGLTAQASASRANEKCSGLEAQNEGTTARLDRIEAKIDRLLEK